MRAPAARAVALAAIVAFFPRAAAALEPADTTFEAGQQLSVLFSGPVTRNLSYVTFKTRPVLVRDEGTGATLELRLGARAFYDFALSSTEVSVRDLALLWRTEHLTATVGFQEVAWGETLGFPVADIVNPRDLRDPYFLDVDFVRLPVAAANVQYTTGPFRAEVLATPVPRSPLLPPSGSPFLPSQTQTILPLPSFDGTNFPKDAEGGGRVGYLVGGWDVGASFLTHWSRVPSYQLTTSGPAAAPALLPVVGRVETFGVSVTKPFGEHLLVRGDSVLNVDQLRQSKVLAAPTQVVESQSVAEADLTLDDDWDFSVQYEYDRQGTLNRHWLSGRAHKGLFEHKLDLSVYGFKGVNNGDAWIEPTVTWSFLDVLSAGVRADFVWGTVGDAGLLGYLDGKHRVFATVRVRL